MTRKSSVSHTTWLSELGRQGESVHSDHIISAIGGTHAYSWYLPFYLSAGTYSPIPIPGAGLAFTDSIGAEDRISCVGHELPFFLTSGVENDIPLVVLAWEVGDEKSVLTAKIISTAEN